MLKFGIPFFLFTLITSMLLQSACKEKHFEADISGIDVSPRIHRFDRELRKYSLEKSDSLIQQYKEKYKDFYAVFNHRILRLGASSEPGYAANLYNFVMYNEAQGIFDNCENVFGDFSEEEQKLEKLFRYYKYHFPNDSLPETVVFLSGLNHSVVTVENFLGIALDKYLGKDKPVYSGAERYLRRRMDKAYIPTDVAAALAEQRFPLESEGPAMFQQMMYKGKVQYFIHSVLPNYPDTLRWIYTSRQLDWAERNEANIWNHLTEDELLYTKDRLKIRQYTGTAPFTIPLSDSSAPRAAVFTGYKIILSYMKNHPEISLKELMNENDYQKILAAANYHPN